MDFINRLFINPQSSDKSISEIKKSVKLVSPPNKIKSSKNKTYKKSPCKGKSYKKCKKRCKWIKKNLTRKGFCRLKFNRT